MTRKTRHLDVKHRILQRRMHATSPPRSRRVEPRTTGRPIGAVQHLAEIATSARAQQIGIVGGRTDADGLGGSAEEVAKVMSLDLHVSILSFTR